MTIYRILSKFQKIIVVEGLIYYAMQADKESVSSKMTSKKPLSAVQNKNRTAILAAALETFSAHGFRGTRLEQIANNAGMSKPNVIYYFPNKEAIFVTLLNSHIDKWLAPLREIDPDGEPLEQVIEYIGLVLEYKFLFSSRSLQPHTHSLSLVLTPCYQE